MNTQKNNTQTATFDRAEAVEKILNDTISKIRKDLEQDDESFLSAIICGEGFNQLFSLTNEELGQELKGIDANQEEISSSKSVFETAKGLAYQKLEGTRFRVFRNLENANKYADFIEIDSELNKLVIASFEEKEEMDAYIEGFEICAGCNRDLFYNDEAYESHNGNVLCGECAWRCEICDRYFSEEEGSHEQFGFVCHKCNNSEIEKSFDDTNYNFDETIISENFDPETQSGMLETFGNDYEQVIAIMDANAHKHLWSVVDGEDNKIHVTAGKSATTPIYYIVTKEEWRNPNETYFLGENFYQEETKKPASSSSIQEIIKTQVCEMIFQNGYPTDFNSTHPYDFFINADVDEREDVESSPLGTEWNFEVSGEHGFENIRSIRGLMQSKYEELESFKTSLFQYAVKSVKISTDDFVDVNEFYSFLQDTNASLYNQGTADEHLIVLSVDAEAVS